MEKITTAILILGISLTALGQERHRAAAPSDCRFCPVRVWYAEEKDDWNHAVAELVEYGGDQRYYAFPLGTPDGHWVFVWETTAAGSVGGFPWRVEAFNSAVEAALRYDGLSSQTVVRKLYSEPSGKVLVIYKCRPDVPCGV